MPGIYPVTNLGYTICMKRIGALQPGCFYHVYNRGNNRENVFVEQRNYPYFLKLYAHYILPIADTFAYCLMPNHFHLFIQVKTEEEMMSAPDKPYFLMKDNVYDMTASAFGAFFMAYTKAINKAYNRTGSLFQERFGRKEVTEDRYYTNLIYYIHQNPRKHGFVQDFRDWQWSSYAAMLSSASTRLSRRVVLDWFGGTKWFESSHRDAVNTALIQPLVEDDFD